MEFLQILILFILLLLFLNLLENIKRLKGQKKLKLIKPLPKISVLIPARNEEKKIKKCVVSILKQSYADFEIIVLDDSSKDRTYDIIRELAGRNKNLKIVKGKELPPGWNGKNWACHQLSLLAKGDWILFTDADTIHGSNSISTALAAAQETKSVFVSLIPGLITKTWSEKLILPVIHFAFLVLVPFKLINYHKDSRLSFGIGPFMLIRKDFYFNFGGHESLRLEIVDDMALARTVKEYKGKITILDGTDILDVKFYDNFLEIWKGLSKNVYEAIGGAVHILAGVLLGCYFLFIFPYLSLWGAIESNHSYSIPLIQVITLSLIKIVLALRFRTNVLYSLLHPLTIIFTLLIMLNSFRLSVFKKKIEWKERLYPIE